MTAPRSQWTFGAELEWPDVNSRAELPPGWEWSRTDYTIVNSDGTANDPTGRRTTLGGETNTPVVGSPDELVAAIVPVWEALQPGYNYRSNLHVHVGIPGLTDPAELETVKRIADFTRGWLPGMLPQLDPLTPLLDGQPTMPALQAARRRQKHSEKSRHHFIPASRHLARMAAPTLEAALAAEVPFSAKLGAPQWHLESREAMNLRALRKHGTIEFRCFAAPRTPEQVGAAAEFAAQWLEHALAERNPRHLLDDFAGRLPRQEPFDARLEAGWQATHGSAKAAAA